MRETIPIAPAFASTSTMQSFDVRTTKPQPYDDKWSEPGKQVQPPLPGAPCLDPETWDSDTTSHGRCRTTFATRAHQEAQPESHFTGKQRDAESGNDYFGARYYASSMGRMLSPDSGVDQHPEDPQSWNLYSYGRNNPLVMVDPTGEYVCGSGITQTMCDNFQNTLDAAQQGANALKDKYGADSTQYKDAQRAIDAYGKEGVDNGVTLNLKEPKPGDAAGVDRNIGSAPKTADNPLGIRINVNFGSDMFSGSADNAPDAAHEGSHVGDAQDWARSGFSPSMNPTRYGTEFRAFNVAAGIAEGTGWPYYGAIVGNQQIYYWKPGWTPAQVSSGINQVLSNPAGHYHLTPNSKILAFQHNTKGGN